MTKLSEVTYRILAHRGQKALAALGKYYPPCLPDQQPCGKSFEMHLAGYLGMLQGYAEHLAQFLPDDEHVKAMDHARQAYLDINTKIT